MMIDVLPSWKDVPDHGWQVKRRAADGGTGTPAAPGAASRRTPSRGMRSIPLNSSIDSIYLMGE